MWFISHQPLCQTGNFLCRDHPLWKCLEYPQDSKWVVGGGEKQRADGGRCIWDQRLWYSLEASTLRESNLCQQRTGKLTKSIFCKRDQSWVLVSYLYSYLQFGLCFSPLLLALWDMLQHAPYEPWSSLAGCIASYDFIPSLHTSFLFLTLFCLFAAIICGHQLSRDILLDFP